MIYLLNEKWEGKTSIWTVKLTPVKPIKILKQVQVQIYIKT